MEVSRRNSAGSRSSVRLLALAVIICIICFNACALKPVYDIVANQDVKPEKLFRKGNYVTDLHLGQYAGVWESGGYRLKTEVWKRV